VTGPQRQASLRLWLDGRPLRGFGDSVLSLEVDERTDEASTLRMTVDLSPVATGAGGDWDALEYGAFADDHGLPGFRLLSRITVQFGLQAAGVGSAATTATVFDGYVTGVEAVFGESRVPDSYLLLTGMDAGCLMHLETVTRSWEDRSDAQIAAELFAKYGFAATPGDSVEDSGNSRAARHPASCSAARTRSSCACSPAATVSSASSSPRRARCTKGRTPAGT
jgi:hypothetical protein